MEQSIVDWREQVSFYTPLRIPQPHFISQRRNHHTRDTPLTPYPVFDKKNKRPLSALEASTAPDEMKRMKCPILLSERSNYGPSPKRLCGDSPLSSSTSPYLKISSAELLRASESILNQVDWLKVALEVAGNRRASVYREAIMLILHTQVYELEIKEAKKEENEEEGKDEEDQDEDEDEGEEEEEEEEEEEDEDKDDEVVGKSGYKASFSV